MLNNGILEQSCADSTGMLDAKVFYNPVLTNGVVDPTQQPIVNQGNPPAALLVTNSASKSMTAFVTDPTGVVHTFNVAPGTTRVSANQLSSLGINTRADVMGFSVSC